MEAFKQLCIRMEDIRQNRLDRVLNSLRCYALCPPPRDATWSPEEFVDVIRDSCKNVMAVRIAIFAGFCCLLMNYEFRKSNGGIGFWRQLWPS